MTTTCTELDIGMFRMFGWFKKKSTHSGPDFSKKILDQFRQRPSPFSDDAVRSELLRAIVNDDSAEFRAVLQASHPALAGQHRLYGVLVMTSDGIRPILVDETGVRLRSETVIEPSTPIDLLNVQLSDGKIQVHGADEVWTYLYEPGEYRLGQIVVYKLCNDPHRAVPDLSEVATALRRLVASPDPDLALCAAKSELEPHWTLPCEVTVHCRSLPLDRSSLDQEVAAEHPECALCRGYDVQFRAVGDGPMARQFRVYLFLALRDPNQREPVQPTKQGS